MPLFGETLILAANKIRIAGLRPKSAVVNTRTPSKRSFSLPKRPNERLIGSICSTKIRVVDTSGKELTTFVTEDLMAPKLIRAN